jgi:SPP1 gp7 family putative phage head morphogenesis protein
MMLSATLDSRPSTDLLTGSEEEILAALIAYISGRTNHAKSNLVNSLSKLLVVSYHVGGNQAAKEIKTAGPLGLEGLDPVLEKLGKNLDGTFGSMSGELTDGIKNGIREGWTYGHIKEDIAAKITNGWGKSITFNSVGQVRSAIQVNPDGTMKRIKVTIERPVTLSTDTYAETLTRTSMKSAYAQGHLTRYENAGYEGWVYLSVADERTRPRHLALHGRVFLYGTPQEEMAREVMREHRCRCRPKAWFNNPKLDTPPDEYHQERMAWARQALDENADEISDDDKSFLTKIAK